MVVDRVKPVREPGRNPLFGVAMQVLDAGNSATGAALPGLRVDWLDEGATQPMFDLNLNFFAVDDGLRAQLSYSSELFDRWRIEALLRHVRHVLGAALADPSLPVSRIPLLSGHEREEVLAAGRGAEVEPWTDPVHAVVARVAAENPEAIAAICEGAELTYGELDRRSRSLAAHLRANGIGPEQIVAIALDRSLEVLIAMLAVWRAGAAFTMLDPRHPPSRLAFMLRDTAAPLLITRTEFLDGLPPSSGWQVLTLDTGWPAVSASCSRFLPRRWPMCSTPPARPGAEGRDGRSPCPVLLVSWRTTGRSGSRPVIGCCNSPAMHLRHVAGGDLGRADHRRHLVLVSYNEGLRRKRWSN